jgi:succinylglutamic semialdehyde dehydrogenase
MALETLHHPGDYVDGSFASPPSPQGELRIASPADVTDLASVHPIALTQVDPAVEAARRAQPEWRRLGDDGRRRLLRRYQERLRVHADSMVETLAREVGKPLWDARSEVNAMIGKIDVMLGEGAEWTRDRAVEDIPAEIRYRPHGVLTVIGPFNFPGHLPNGQIVPALLLGNTVVFKPSDKAPSIATWMARCFDEAGFPPGVFNMVQGQGPSAERLVQHDDVDGILFTGSQEVGSQIMRANADRPGRLVALELGGKNASIVLDDCDLEWTVRQLAFAAYASAGQRCTATSRVYVTRGVTDRLVERLSEVARQIAVGYPLDEGVFMGPMIEEQARSRLLAALERAGEAGFEPVVESRVCEVPGRQGWYVTPGIHRAPTPDVHVPGYTHEELFGPDMAIYEVEDLEHAIQLANATRYGLATAVFTRSRESFERAAEEVRSGLLHWNRSTAGASGRLPFGGIKDSGNHRPAGIMAGVFCSYPMAVQHTPGPDASLPSWPGLLR